MIPIQNVLSEDLIHNGRLLARKGTPITDKMIPYLSRTPQKTSIFDVKQSNKWLKESLFVLAHESRYGQLLNGENTYPWLQTCLSHLLREEDVQKSLTTLKKENELVFLHTLDVFFLFILWGKKIKANHHSLYQPFIQYMIKEEPLDTLKNHQVKHMLDIVSTYSTATWLHRKSSLTVLASLLVSHKKQNVRGFMEALHRYPLNTNVLLSNGHLATILSYDHPLLPIVIDHTEKRQYRLPLNRNIHVQTIYEKKRPF